MPTELVNKNLVTLYDILSKYDNGEYSSSSTISIKPSSIVILAKGEAREFLLIYIPIRYVRRISRQHFNDGYTKWEIPLKLFDKELNISN